MGVRKYKPTSAGRRNSSVNDYSELTTSRPEKTLCKRIKKRGGRNHHGVTTTRFRGGGARRIYRMIDFKRNKDDMPATVTTIEYDPNRSCFISLVRRWSRRRATRCPWQRVRLALRSTMWR